MLMKDTKGNVLERTDLLKKVIGVPDKVTTLKTSTTAGDYAWTTKQATAEADRIITQALQLNPKSVTSEQEISDARDLFDRALRCATLQCNSIHAQLAEPEDKGRTPKMELAFQDWRRRARGAYRHRLQVKQDIELKIDTLNRLHQKPKEVAMPTLVEKPTHSNVNTPPVPSAAVHTLGASDDAATFLKVAELILPAETVKKLWEVVRLMQSIRSGA